MAAAPSTLVQVAALSRMLLEVLERPDGGMASQTLLADLRELSERAHAELAERAGATDQ
jgi:hypothetical protein